MWPFRRREHGADQRPSGPVHRAPRSDWRQLQPMPVQTARLSTVDAGFERTLSTRRDPSFLAPLGHQLASSAPRGRVAAAARREPVAFSPAPVGVQRQTMTYSAPRPVEVVERAEVPEFFEAPAVPAAVATAIVPDHGEVANSPVRPEEAVAAGSEPAVRPASTAATRREPPPVVSRSPDRPSPLVVARTPDLPAATFPTVGVPPAVAADEAGPEVHESAATEETTVALTGDKPALTSPSPPEPLLRGVAPAESPSPSPSPASPRPAGPAPQPARRCRPASAHDARTGGRGSAAGGTHRTTAHRSIRHAAPAGTSDDRAAHERAHPSFGRAGSQDAGHDDGGRRHPVNRGPDGERRHAGQ